MGREEGLGNSIISARMRWLAVVAAFSSTLVGMLSAGWLFLMLGSFLILGAAVQPWAPTSGRWLMWVGALVLSQFTIPVSFTILFRDMKTLQWDHYDNVLAISSLFAVSAVLLLWCDIALVMEAFTSKRHRWARGSMDWVAWISAGVLSLWQVWSGVLPAVHSYRFQGGLRLDILLITLGLVAVILFFDVALIVHAVKSRRTE